LTKKENDMLDHHARRLIHRLMSLLVLAAALLLASPGTVERKAIAATPCEQCEENYNSCLIGCGDPAPGACLFHCEWSYDRCLRTCT
jgi:hypothetical protein